MANEVRMIDANALKAKFCNHCDERDCKPDATDTVYGCVIADTIDSMPTIEAQPIKRGKLLINCDGYYPYCSNCKKEPQGREMTDYCPNCGSYMKDGDKDA